MKVAIRADASPAVGSGHVMRCLALADAVVAGGGSVSFVTRGLPAHLAALLHEHGHAHQTLTLDPPDGQQAPQQGWPSIHQQADAQHTVRVLTDQAPDWLVVDHYGLDRHWEEAVRPHVGRLLAVDDLGRSHACDLLVDGNHDPTARERYEASAPGAWLLLGCDHLLLRPEFAVLHRETRPRAGPVRRLMVFLGGMDAGNATGRVLAAVRRLKESPALDVVVGASHPALAEIQAFCATRPSSTCHVQTADMAALLASCDAAVGAGGGANWERCCLGVPTLALALAANQEHVLQAAAAAGLVVLPDGGLPDVDLLAAHLEAFLHNSALRSQLSAAGWSLVDGRGTARVVTAMLGTALRLRPATANDADDLYAWRNAPAVRAVSRNSAAIDREDHRRWLAAVLQDPQRLLLVGEDRDGPVGAVRFDIAAAEAEVSIHLAPQRRGQGLGPALLRGAERWLARHRPDVSAVIAEVLDGNPASTRLFEQAGYRCASHRYRKRSLQP